MRNSLTLAGTLLTFTGLAQNWVLINPTYKYNYSNDGTDTISNQVFAMDAQALGLDTSLYVLNPVASTCSPCDGVPILCTADVGLYVGQPQAFGVQAMKNSSDWTLFGDDTLRVLVDAMIGANWASLSGVQGTVTAAAEQLLFGQPDSVKTIDFSNGSTLVISKEHGIIAYSTLGEQFELIGIQGGIDVGEHFPTLLDLFDYQPGDVLQYHGTDAGTTGFCYFNTTYVKKYEILSRSDLPGHTDYSVHLVTNSQTWSTPTGGGGECTGGSFSHQTILTLGVGHDDWSEENFFGSCYLDQLWPQAFGAPLDNGAYPGEFGSYFGGIQWKASLDEQGRYTLEPTMLEPNQPELRRTVYRCEEDTSYWSVNFETMLGRYVEGVGMTYGNALAFERSSEKILEGYVIGGVEFGTITPDDIILGTNERAAADSPYFYPNPATDHLLLSAVTPGAMCSITDLHGRTVMQHRINSSNERIDLQTLPSGVYVLMTEGIQPQLIVIAR